MHKLVSISRNLKAYVLEELKENISVLSGSVNVNWEEAGTINIAIYETLEKVTVSKVRKTVKNFKGFTKSNKLIAYKTRIKNIETNEFYIITNVKNSVWNNISLESIEAF